MSDVCYLYQIMRVKLVMFRFPNVKHLPRIGILFLIFDNHFFFRQKQNDIHSFKLMVIHEHP